MTTKTPAKLIQPKIEASWLEVLSSEFNFPPGNEIFAAFNRTPFDKVKVIIIGQDPYHGLQQANGLCFSVSDGIPHPPSLVNIFKELESDLNYPYPKSGDLKPWADQGVLLLNAALTVRKGEANSHSKIGWEQFTDKVIYALSSKKNHLIFLLWGGFAKRKGKIIDRSKHHILERGHPSPLCANKGHWVINKHFSKTNQLLVMQGKEPINWQLS